MFSGRALVVIIGGALTVLISMGLRQSFGIFLQPISESLGVGREVFSLAIAWQNLIFGLPLVGFLADKIGPRWVIFLGALLYGISLAAVSLVTSSSGLYLFLGVLTGLALSGTTFVVVLGAVGQVVPARQRSTAFGIITAAGSFGMFAIVPGAQWALSSFGWQNALLVLGGFVSLTALIAFLYPGKPAATPVGVSGDSEVGSLPQILSKAGKHSGYWLLTIGFFVCGFHVSFIATHLPAFLTDNALSPEVGATALAMIGLANLVGSYTFGTLGDRYRKKRLLSLLYFGRAVVISLFLLIPITNVSAIVFGGAIGFLWLATVPLTSGMVAQIFGSRYLSTLYGVVFFSHQIGAFLGVWLGGRVYDATGTYTSVWIGAIILSLIATVLHMPITDRPLVVEQPVPEAVA